MVLNDLSFASVVVGILLFNIVLAFVRNRKITFEVYAADPHKYSWPIITVTLVSTIVGGGMFLGVGQIGYEAGVTGWLIGVIYLVGFIVTGSLAVKMRRLLDEEGRTTLIDVIDAKFGNRIGTQFSLVSGLMYMFLLAAQFVALLRFMEFVQPHMDRPWLPWLLVGLAFIALFLYPLIGGLRKDIQTDIFQTVIVGIAAVLLVMTIANPTVVSATLKSLPESKQTGMGYGLLFIVGAALFLPLSFLVRMDIWQRVKAAKDINHLRIAFLVSGFAALFFFWLFTTVGMRGYHLGSGRAEFVVLDVIHSEISNPIVVALLIGGFFAAIIGSADTLINNVSLFATRAFTPKMWSNRGVHDRRRLLRSARIYAVGVIIVSTGLAFGVPNFVDLLVGALSLLLVFLPVIVGLFIPKLLNPKAAFWSANIGLFVFLILFFGGMPKVAFAPSVILTLLCFTIMRLFCKGRVEDNPDG